MAKQVAKGRTDAKTKANAKTAGAKAGKKGAQDEINPELLTAGQQALKGIVFAEEIVASSTEENDDLGLMSAGHAPLDKAGFSMQVIFNGRKRIFSDKFEDSKAKKVLMYNGEEHTYRDVIVVTDAAGKSFSIFLNGSLSSLTRCLPRNAPIKLTYEGKQLITEGAYADGVAEEHVFALVTDAASKKVVDANQFQKGCMNWLNNPAEPREKDTTPKELANLKNYENDIRSGKLVVSEAEKQRVLGAGYQAQAQIAQ
jgi:hypothetical protein